MNSNFKPLLLSSGEPAGIGPDLCLLLAAENQLQDTVVAGELNLFRQRAAQLGLHDLSIAIYPERAALRLLPFHLPVTCHAGEPDKRNANYVIDMIENSARAVMRGDFSALVTAPVHKGIINAAGIPFTGHTEALQRLAAVDQVVMMLTCEELRVALATTHLPLNFVAAAINQASLSRILEIIHQDFSRYFNLPQVKIAVCGLNPHAGEDGYLGREEVDIIAPVIRDFQRRGCLVDGPFPADSLFVPTHRQPYDVILSMYHDQGLPVLKALGFGHAANITLGLPFIRTSVDHGTALKLAGSGQIHTSSLLYALQTARLMVNNHAASLASISNAPTP